MTEFFQVVVLVNLNGKNAAGGEDDITYANSNLKKCTASSAWNGEEMYMKFHSYKKPYLNLYEGKSIVILMG